MPTETALAAPRKPEARSRVTNGTRIIEGVDGRTRAGRRLADIIAALTGEIGSAPTEAEKLQIRTAASLALHVERLTAQMVVGDVDPEALSRANNALVRALNGLKRRGRPKRSRGVREALFADIAATRTGGGAA